MLLVVLIVVLFFIVMGLLCHCFIVIHKYESQRKKFEKVYEEVLKRFKAQKGE